MPHSGPKVSFQMGPKCVHFGAESAVPNGPKVCLILRQKCDQNGSEIWSRRGPQRTHFTMFRKMRRGPFWAENVPYFGPKVSPILDPKCPPFGAQSVPHLGPKVYPISVQKCDPCWAKNVFHFRPKVVPILNPKWCSFLYQKNLEFSHHFGHPFQIKNRKLEIRDRWKISVT